MKVETKVEEGMNSYIEEYKKLEEEFCREYSHRPRVDANPRTGGA